jgi:anti-sigma factor RsiW
VRDQCERLEHLHSAWVDAELRTGERARLAAHLQRCPPCRASVQGLRVTRTMLASLPPRGLPGEVAVPAAAGPARPAQAGLRRMLARSAVTVLAAVTVLSAAAFAVGSPEPQGRQVAVPVDVYVADHLVRAVGGPVSTPALLQARP